MGTGCRDEFAAGRSARGRQSEGRGRSHAHGAEDGLLARGTDEGRSSVRGERDRDKLVGRKWTSNGLPCGASGAEVSWLETDKFFFSFFSFLCGVGGALGVRTRSWRWTSGR
ncbi:hypothetical protein SORBI_3002G066600 [Sorghum bicolor]|uniref:Uncharacterized protein n=1 Tax=Sorghum bicolor TaxID=4558 RepID=A0A1B6Q9L4_SORBI|nr:hypothetical protein SORBI_3002G066600 [Sorghum bicolor]